jgi:uncharacterized DUF497 family protein
MAFSNNSCLTGLTDTNRIEFESEQGGERRFQTIGDIEGIIIVLVVYTHRSEKRRIISARRASKKGRAVYYHSR